MTQGARAHKRASPLAHTAPHKSPAGGANRQIHPRRRGRRARARPSGRSRSATAPTSRICATRPSPATGRRQLPRLHGRDRGRARAGRELHPQADARHEGEDAVRPRQDRAQDGVRAADRRPARAQDRGARSGFEVLELGRPAWGSQRAASPSARRRPRPTAAIRRWRSISTPASSAICASAPAAKCRSTT